MRIYLGLFLTFFACNAYAQVRGSILDPAVPVMNPMDPNGDGFITSSGAAFVGPLDHSEFELFFLPFQQYSSEPGADGGVDGVAMPDDDDQFMAVITHQQPVRVDQPANIAPLPVDATVSIDENEGDGFLLHTVMAQDANGDAVVFSITGGNLYNAFAVDPVTGALTISNPLALDREITSSFVLLVQASDGSLYDNAVITVNVNDVNDNYPSALDMGVDVPENSSAGTIVNTVNATDRDPTSVLIYSIKGGSAEGLFELDPKTGVITVAEAPVLDFETANSFTLIVEVSDGFYVDEAEITINVIDVNEPPTVTSASITLEDFKENDIIHTVVASDPDAGDVLTYAMQGGNLDAAFAIDTQQGTIAVNDRSELRPTRTQLQLIITATDRGGLSGQGVVDITMADTPVEGIVPERGFSPNGDSLNDFWLIRGIEAFPDNQMRVFSRWGNLVYEASGYDNTLHRWYGEVNGARVVLENTYFFIITAAAQSMTGYVIVKP